MIDKKIVEYLKGSGWYPYYDDPKTYHQPEF